MGDPLESVYFKSYSTEKGIMIAMCDKELLGKVLTEGKVELDLERYAAFYKGELISQEDAVEKLKEDRVIYSANIVGKASVDAFIKAGIIARPSVKTINKVPFLQVYNVL